MPLIKSFRNYILNFDFDQQFQFYYNKLKQFRFNYSKMLGDKPRIDQNENKGRQQAISQQQESEAQDYNAFLYKFQQQIIDAWKPVPHTSSNIILYTILSIICISLGLILILTAVDDEEVTIRYDNFSNCTLGTSGCSTTFTLSQTLEAPVYLYYGFTNFYQNHRRYIKFFSTTQLNSGQLAESQAATDCGSFVTNDQLGYTANSYANDTLVTTATGFPCGTVGRMYNKFRPQLQSYVLKKPDTSTLTYSKDNIAWSSDIGRHKNYDLNLQPFSVQEEDWLVFYRPAARDQFFKLFGIVQEDMAAGTYTFEFQNTFDASFGEKRFHISKSNYIGNRDLFLGIAFLILGGGCFILLIVFIAKWIAERRDKQHIN